MIEKLVQEMKLELEPSVPVTDLQGDKAQDGEERGWAFLSLGGKETSTSGGFTPGEWVEHGCAGKLGIHGIKQVCPYSKSLFYAHT